MINTTSETTTITQKLRNSVIMFRDLY